VKNSFYLVIPEQNKNNEFLLSYDKASVNQWVSSLPIANPSLAAQLFYDFVKKLNATEISLQQRLQVIELLRPCFFKIKRSLCSQLIGSGFPKGDDEKNVFELLVSIEREFTLGYWLVVREITHRNIKWLQGKNAALAIQRTIKGLAGIVTSYSLMFLPVPDWVWIDLHSLYKLSVKIKKENTKVPDEATLLGKSTSAEDSYIQVLLFSLSDPAGLMQREMHKVINLIDSVSQFVSIEKRPVNDHNIQCVVLIDEDRRPYFNTDKSQINASSIFLNLTKLLSTLTQSNKFSSKQQTRFGVTGLTKKESKKISEELLIYLRERWSGIDLKGDSLFSDRLDRYVAVGMSDTYSLLSSNNNLKHEELAKSFSETQLTCQFSREGALSVGSLVSYRQTKAPEYKRYLGLVNKITMPKLKGKIGFEILILSKQIYTVSYMDMEDGFDSKSKHYKALLYRVKTNSKEKTTILMASGAYKNGDIVRMFMKEKYFPIMLGGGENIGQGYWQFECRRIDEEKNSQFSKK
jgi:hypothetical protein